VPNHAATATWLIAALATAGVILRPWRVPEAAWAVGGALALLVAGLLPWREALHAVARGADVYWFLAGMMLLAELARREGVFEFCADFAVRRARGSAQRLFAWVYAIGIVVTVFMSNDATAVVLTPAVCAVARKAGARPLPYLLACAFIANAASFVLPISNPANLVVYGAALPPLALWLQQFALPSLAAIAVTYAGLKWLYRDALAGSVSTVREPLALGPTGRIAALGILGVAAALLTASALALPLGLPTFVATALVAVAIGLKKREAPWPALQQVSWSVLLLVAGLFVLVEGLMRTGVVAALADVLQATSHQSTVATVWAAGAVTAVASNLVNNLPAGLIAGTAMSGAGVPHEIQSAIAIGIDLGPNLSVTGSLATILWLIAIRHEGENVTAWQFLRVGAVLMPLALCAALGVLVLQTSW
jgi:arsenical pump membrane protein